MEYNLIVLPSNLEIHSLNFASLTRKEARTYLKWFVEEVPKRTLILQKAVNSTPNYESWRANFTSDSLQVLSAWFHDSVETRERTARELEQIYHYAPPWFREVQVSKYELTDQTFSIAVDVGRYFGEILLRQYPTLEWKLVTRPKNSIDFHQPVLSGFKGKQWLNPTRIILNTAYGFVRKTRSPERLLELYEVWASLVS
jgi:hypothetical protein